MREVKFDQTRAKELLTSLSQGETRFEADRWGPMLAGVSLAMATLLESVAIEKARKQDGRVIAREHREIEYAQRTRDMHATAVVITDLVHLDSAGNYEAYCEPKVRALVRATQETPYGMLPVEEFIDRPDGPYCSDQNK